MSRTIRSTDFKGMKQFEIDRAKRELKKQQKRSKKDKSQNKKEWDYTLDDE